MDCSEVPSFVNRRQGEERSVEEEEPSSSMTSGTGGGEQIESGVNLLPSQTNPLSSVGTMSTPSSSSSMTGSLNEDGYQTIISGAARLNSENLKLKGDLALEQQKSAEKDAEIGRQNDELGEAANLQKKLKERLDVALGNEKDSKEKLVKAEDQLAKAEEKLADAEEKLVELKNSWNSCFDKEFLRRFENARKLFMDDKDGQRTTLGQTVKNTRKDFQSTRSNAAVGGGDDQSSPPTKRPALHPESPNPGPPVAISSEAQTSAMISTQQCSTASETRHDMSTASSTEPLAKYIGIQGAQPELKVTLSRLPIKPAAGPTKVQTAQTIQEGCVALNNNAEDISKRKQSSVSLPSASSSSCLTEFGTTGLSVPGGPRSKDVRESHNEPVDDEVSPTVSTSSNPSLMISGKKLHRRDMTKRAQGFLCSCGNAFTTRTTLDDHIQFENKPIAIEGQTFHGIDTEKPGETRPFYCFCGKKYLNRKRLQAHIRYANKEREFICHKCGKEYPFESCLKRHFEGKHKIGGNSGGEEVPSTNKAKRQKMSVQNERKVSELGKN